MKIVDYRFKIVYILLYFKVDYRKLFQNYDLCKYIRVNDKMNHILSLYISYVV